MLVYPQGLESIAAFFSCLDAGVVAIPAPTLLSDAAQTHFANTRSDRIQPRRHPTLSSSTRSVLPSRFAASTENFLEIKDARERYTNIKISYLLQKMAEYEDIAILTFVNLLHEEKSDRPRQCFLSAYL
ncbi:hypothetical protein [uncultured Nostoc sp.]|uniref:hypothetical protein n=1 Tax=uncultured Nostoc sp. TaxID=340711 RepID=UPI0035CAE387